MRGKPRCAVRTAGKARVELKPRSNQTEKCAERKLWFALRDRRLGGFKFSNTNVGEAAT